MPGLTALPPFPSDVQTHPLLIVDFALLKAGDAQEIDKLWEAATVLGFWYLKNHGAEDYVDDMFDMGAETMQLPLSQKKMFSSTSNGAGFGYKEAGVSPTDKDGTLDNIEFINVAQDDALAWPRVVHRTYPEPVNARMASTITPFVRKSIDVNLVILNIFNDKLGLPEGTMSRLHSLDEPSGSQARCTRTSPRPRGTAGLKPSLQAHTDFGSLSFLHNRLGGLQVMPPGTDTWQYVKPLPGHAICNIGDALYILSGGILKSSLHRVVPPPGEQSLCERWSLVVFTRPYDSVNLRTLSDSQLIADAVTRAIDKSIFETGQTAAQWLARRVRYSHATNSEDASEFRGTEHRETF